MPGNKRIILALTGFWKAGKAVILPEIGKALPPAGKDLMRVALMANIKNQTIPRCVRETVSIKSARISSHNGPISSLFSFFTSFDE